MIYAIVNITCVVFLGLCIFLPFIRAVTVICKNTMKNMREEREWRDQNPA